MSHIPKDVSCYAKDWKGVLLYLSNHTIHLETQSVTNVSISLLFVMIASWICVTSSTQALFPILETKVLVSEHFRDQSCGFWIEAWAASDPSAASFRVCFAVYRPCLPPCTLAGSQVYAKLQWSLHLSVTYISQSHLRPPASAVRPLSQRLMSNFLSIVGWNFSLPWGDILCPLAVLSK